MSRESFRYKVYNDYLKVKEVNGYNIDEYFGKLDERGLLKAINWCEEHNVLTVDTLLKLLYVGGNEYYTEFFKVCNTSECDLFVAWYMKGNSGNLNPYYLKLFNFLLSNNSYIYKEKGCGNLFRILLVEGKEDLYLLLNIGESDIIDAVTSDVLNRLESAILKDKENLLGLLNRGVSDIDAVTSDVLSSFEFAILKDYLMGGETYDSLANKNNVTRERVRNVYLKSLYKVVRGMKNTVIPYNKEIIDGNAVYYSKPEWLAKNNNILKMGIEVLNLSSRSYNCLKRTGAHTLEDVLSVSDRLLDIRNMGRKGEVEVLEALSTYCLGLKVNRYTSKASVNSKSVDLSKLAVCEFYKLDGIDLSVSTVHNLIRGGFNTLEEVVLARDEMLLSIDNFSLDNLREVQDFKLGLIEYNALKGVSIFDIDKYGFTGMSLQDCFHLKRKGYTTVGDLVDSDDDVLSVISPCPTNEFLELVEELREAINKGNI